MPRGSPTFSAALMSASNSRSSERYPEEASGAPWGNTAVLIKYNLDVTPRPTTPSTWAGRRGRWRPGGGGAPRVAHGADPAALRA